MSNIHRHLAYFSTVVHLHHKTLGKWDFSWGGKCPNQPYEFVHSSKVHKSLTNCHIYLIIRLVKY